MRGVALCRGVVWSRIKGRGIPPRGGGAPSCGGRGLRARVAGTGPRGGGSGIPAGSPPPGSGLGGGGWEQSSYPEHGGWVTPGPLSERRRGASGRERPVPPVAVSSRSHRGLVREGPSFPSVFVHIRAQQSRSCSNTSEPRAAQAEITPVNTGEPAGGWGLKPPVTEIKASTQLACKYQIV